MTTPFLFKAALLASLLALGACKKDPPPAAPNPPPPPPPVAAVVDAGAVAARPANPPVVDAGMPRRVSTPPKAGDLIATLETTVGNIQIRLFAAEAPKTVANFMALVDGSKPWRDPRSGQDVRRPFYDGLTFHSVLAGTAVQAGDPLGDGTGGPGFTIEDEFHPLLRHDRPGMVTMANRGKNTGGSQFIITLRPLPLLDDRNAVFGEVVGGLEVVEAISKVPAAKSKPTQDVVIRRISIKKLA